VYFVVVTGGWRTGEAARPASEFAMHYTVAVLTRNVVVVGIRLHCALSRRLASDGPIPPREPVCLPVCLSVCLSVCQHVSQNRRSRLHLLFRACYLWCDSVFLCRHCDMLCISGFVYDVTFSHKGDLSIPLQRRHCGVVSGLLLLLFKKIFLAHQHKATVRKTRLDVQNYGCNGNLLCYHGVVDRNRISSLQSHGQALEKECCFPGVFCDSGDTPANLLCELNGHLMPCTSCFYGK